MGTKDENQQSEMITKSALKREYGLTDKLIEQLGEPDATRPNPHFRKAAPMLLYSRDRVEKWIASNPESIDQSNPRKSRALKAAETKRQQAQKMVDEALKQLKLNPIPKDIAVRTQLFIGERFGAYGNEPTPKAIASHIRHNYTNYEELLSKIKGKVGKGDLYLQIKDKLNAAIESHYGYNSEGRT